jgi:hypothetical protein
MSAISSFASAFRGGQMPRPVRCSITPLADDVPSNEQAGAATRIFQYFPESIQDSRQVDYQAKPIPGLSHPLYQWTTGGGREISFVSIFTRDRILTDQEKLSLQLSTISQTPGLATGFAMGGINVNTPSPVDLRNVDIPSAISWLRSYTYPEYGSSGQNQYSRPRPPRRLILTLPGMRINQGTPELCDDDMRAVMTQCDVTHEGFFNDGTPRISRVNLAFTEIIQYSNGVTPVGASGLRSIGLAGYRLTAPKAR